MTHDPIRLAAMRCRWASLTLTSRLSVFTGPAPHGVKLGFNIL